MEMLPVLPVDWEKTVDAILALGLWRGAIAYQNYEILTRRFGLVSGEAETLEAIGRDLGITRERVRQIQAKGLPLIWRHIESVHSYGSFISLIQQELTKRGGAVRKEEILALLDLEKETLRYSPDMAVAFMLWMSPFSIELPRKDNNHWTVYESDDEASQLLMVTRRIHEHILRTGPLGRGHLVGAIANSGVETAVVSTALTVDSATTESEGYVWLVDWPRWHVVVASLRQIGTPAHFMEVTRQVNNLLAPNDRMTERAVHGILGNHEPVVFRRVGLGTFGLAEWGLPAAKDSVDLVCQILEGETAWLTPQQIAIKARSIGWQTKRESIIIALDLEHQKPNRRVRRTQSATFGKYGLSWWNDP